MIEKPIIAISQRIDDLVEIKERRDCLDQKLSEWVELIGAIPVGVPNSMGRNLEVWLNSLNPKGFILSGGNNIGAFKSRDNTEKILIDYASSNKLPLLGICRGMQMLGSYNKTPLIKVLNHVGKRHMLKGELVNNGELPKEVNSFHDYALKKCPKDYEILSISEDETIEAIRNTKLNWEGWMWHPEREYPFSKIDLKRAKKIFIRDTN